MIFLTIATAKVIGSITCTHAVRWHAVKNTRSRFWTANY